MKTSVRICFFSALSGLAACQAILGIGDRTEIEHFDGPHTIHGVGTYDFLKRWLK